MPTELDARKLFIGPRLKRLRRDLALTQTRMAEDLGMSPSYLNLLERNQRPIESSEELPVLRRAGETAAFGLRLLAGWPFETFRATTGHDLRDEWAT